MSKTDKNLQALNWLDKEKRKDNLEVKSSKEKLVNEFSKLKKEDLFIKEPTPKKTVWERIRQMIWGN